MKTIAIILALFLPFVSAMGQEPGKPRLSVSVDPRVELMSIIFRLAGNREYNQSNSASPYAKAVKKHFARFADHAVILRAAHLRRTRGVSYDAVMAMAMHITDTVKLQERIPFDQKPERLDKRWRLQDARTFLKEARDFVKKSGFNRFINQHQSLFKKTARRMEQTLAKGAYISWCDTFFGAKKQAMFKLSPGMLLGGACYGCGIRFPAGKEVIHPIIGVWTFDRRGIPVFPDTIASTVAHELCHSYINPIVDIWAGKLQQAGEKLFSTCAKQMRRMAYGNWRTMLYESMVRACVIIYMQDTGGKVAAQKEAVAQHKKGFKWVPELAACLVKYTEDRKRYPGLIDFMPEVEKFFTAQAAKIKKGAGNAPRVVSINPVNGAKSVDPGLLEIVVVFDRPMENGMWSVVGGGPNFPRITGKVYYRKDLKTFVMPVKLKPGWSYQFWLNYGKYNTFRSQKGVPLKPVKVTFSTGS